MRIERTVCLAALLSLLSAPFYPAGAAPSAQPAAPTQDEPPEPADPKAEAYFEFCLGRMYYMQMDVERAITHYRNAAALDPMAAYPNIALAEILQRLRRLDEAVQAAKKAAVLEPEEVAAHRMLAKLYFALLRNDGSPDIAPLAIEAYEKTVELDPGDVQSRTELARLLLASRRSEDAARHLEEVIRFEPQAYYEMYLLAQVKNGSGDSGSAIKLLKQSLEIEPRQPEARELLVSLLTEEGRFAELADVYAAAAAEAPDDVETLVRLADALANAGELDRAAEAFDRALAEDPENVIAMVGLAMVRRELKDLDAAEDLLEKALRRERNHLLARFTLAGVLEEKRRYEDAIVQWQKLLELPNPSARPERDGLRKAEYWAHIGFAHSELGRHDAAIDAFAEAKGFAPKDERFEAFYIQELLTAKKAEQARRALDEAQKAIPGSLRLSMLESQVIDALGRSEEAVRHALALAAEEPDSDMLARAVVELYQRQSRYEEAESFLRQRLDSGSNKDNVGLLFQLAAVLERQGDYDEAERFFKRVLEIDPDSGAALNYLGYMLADRNVRLEESLGYLERALEQDPYNGAYLDSIGWLYFRMGELELAEQNMLKAISSLRLTGVVYDHLGDLYYEKGNLDQAVEYWQKALAEDDDELEKESVVRKIEQATER